MMVRGYEADADKRNEALNFREMNGKRIIGGIRIGKRF